MNLFIKWTEINGDQAQWQTIRSPLYAVEVYSQLQIYAEDRILTGCDFRFLKIGLFEAP